MLTKLYQKSAVVIKIAVFAIAFTSFLGSVSAQTSISIDMQNDKRPISPYIYGKNNCFNNEPGKTTVDSLISLYKEAGVRIFREGGGNNSTKYNYRLKLCSHPDWYNNVYATDWGIAAAEIQTKFPKMQGLFSLQLSGWVPKSTDFNFDCWNYDSCKGDHNNSNWAGGVTVEQASANPGIEGTPDKYLEPWPADSAVGILKNWFSPAPNGLGLDSNCFRYWNMDNEPEMWSYTHDDVFDTSFTAEEYMQNYFAVAKKAREVYPGIRLVGPVFTNDWYWYVWANNKTVNTKVNGKDTSLCWMEFFIKRIAEEQKSSGVRLLDVLDFHFYPGYANAAKVNELLQVHRIFYDTTYLWPGSNGIHVIDNNWNQNSANYTFLRAKRWMDHYLGNGNNVSIGMTEYGMVSGDGNASVQAVQYASILGTFGRNGVEIFTPWDWHNSWWEVLHLFSRYGQPSSLKAISSNDSLISAYPMEGKDTLTIIVVNRSAVNQSVSVTCNAEISASSANTFQISNLPSGMTFKSHTDNALVQGSIGISNSTFNMNLPGFSVTAVIISNHVGVISKSDLQHHLHKINYSGVMISVPEASGFDLLNMQGKVIRTVRGGVQMSLNQLSNGFYLVRVPQTAQLFRIVIDKN